MQVVFIEEEKYQEIKKELRKEDDYFSKKEIEYFMNDIGTFSY